jgi:hypothetical protein
VRRHALLACLACLALFSAAPAAAEAASDRLDTAVIDPAALTGGSADLAFRRIHGAGATMVRIVVYWSWVAPDARPTGFDPSNPAATGYRWALTDAQVRRAVGAGLQPILAISRAPTWARDHAGGARSTWADPDELARFAHAAALRYNGAFIAGDTPLPAVRYWQLWNEPNAGRELFPQFQGRTSVSPGAYRGMLLAFTPAVHEVNPANVVIAGGTAPFGHHSRDIQVTAPMRFMRQLLCISEKQPYRPTCAARVPFDVWAHNPYTNGGPTHRAYSTDDVSLGDLTRMNALLRAAVRVKHVNADHPVRFFVTEFSWDSSRPDPRGVPLRLHARWVAQALYEMWRADVSVATWFRLRDDPLATSPYQSGLYFYAGNQLAADKPKPAFRAFRFPFVAFRRASGIAIWGRTPGGSPEDVIVEGRTRRGWRTLARLSTNAHGLFARRLPGFAGATVRARLALTGEASLGFSLAPSRDRAVFPFGCGGPIKC